MRVDLAARTGNPLKPLIQTAFMLQTWALSSTVRLFLALAVHDSEVARHSAAVAVYARDINIGLGLGEEQQARAFVAGLIHDLGKLDLRPGLLSQKASLSAADRKEMEQHPVLGAWAAALHYLDAELVTAVLHHHERYDGTGYPCRLAGRSIPLLARILAIADAYNAMTSDRPYRAAISPLSARRKLAAHAGEQFDPEVVLVFDEILARADEAYRRGIAFFSTSPADPRLATERLLRV